MVNSNGVVIAPTNFAAANGFNTNGAGVSATLAPAKIYIGNALSNAAAQAVSGDLTLATNGSASLTASGTAGTYAQATFDSKGRETSGAAVLPINAGGTGQTTASGAAKAFGAYPNTFLPTMLPNLTLWLRADSLTNLDGVKVSSWTDSSGSGNTTTQGTGANQPTFHTNRINLMPAVTFDGSATRMATPSFLSSAYDKAFTFIQVANKVGTSLRVTSAAGGTQWFSGREPNSGYYYQPFGGTIISSPPFDNTQPCIETFRYDGTNVTLRINGVTVQTSPQSGNLGLSGALTIGDLAAGGFTWDGDIGDMLVFNASLSDGDATLVERYEAGKYNLAKAKIIFEGDSITFGMHSTGTNNYPGDVVASLGGLASWSAANMGISGRTAATMLYSDTQSIINSQHTASDIVVIMAGSNDLAVNGTSAATTYSYIVSLCQLIQLSGYQVVICTITARNGSGDNGGFDANRLTVNSNIRLNWRTFANACADVGSDAVLGQSSQTTNTTYFFSDQIHPVNAGYVLLANYVTQAITRLQMFPASITGTIAPTGWTNITSIPCQLVWSGGTATNFMANSTPWLTNSSGTVIVAPNAYLKAAGSLTGVYTGIY